MASSVSSLCKHNQIWLGNQWQQAASGISSGFAELDQQLAGQGWPKAGVVELIGDLHGIGELLQPVLKQKQSEDRWQICIAPPAQPYAPAWAQAGVNLSRLLWIDTCCRKEQLWSLEHSLNSGRCSVMLAWLDELSSSEARRLQLAAQKGQCLLFVQLPDEALAQSHPVSARLTVTATANGCLVRVVKQRGGWPQSAVALPLPLRPVAPQTLASQIGHSQTSTYSDTVAQGPW